MNGGDARQRALGGPLCGRRHRIKGLEAYPSRSDMIFFGGKEGERDRPRIGAIHPEKDAIIFCCCPPRTRGDKAETAPTRPPPGRQENLPYRPKSLNSGRCAAHGHRREGNSRAGGDQPGLPPILMSGPEYPGKPGCSGCESFMRRLDLWVVRRTARPVCCLPSALERPRRAVAGRTSPLPPGRAGFARQGSTRTDSVR